MSDNSQLEKLRQLFRGSTLSYGLAADRKNPDGSLQRDESNKVISDATHVRGEIPAQAWADHLGGKKRLGVVPAREIPSCWFGGIDIDEYAPPFPEYATVADYYRQRCEDLNLKLVATATRSGGCRLLAFFPEPVPTAWLRAELRRQAVSVLGLPEKTEIFPKQDVVSQSNLGNYIFLPWFGEGRVPDSITYADLPKHVRDFYQEQERREQISGLPYRSGWDPRAALQSAGLRWEERAFGAGCWMLAYHREMGKCFLKDAPHSQQANNNRQSAFVIDEKNRRIWHTCFDSDCQSAERKTVTALENLGIHLADFLDVDADFSDAALAERFATESQDRLLHVSDGSWLEYQQGAWWELTDAPIHECSLVLKSLSPGLPDRPLGETKEQAQQRKSLTALHYRLNSQKAVQAALYFAKARPELKIDAQDLDPDPWLLGLSDGHVLDLKNGITRPAGPSDLITRQLPVAPRGQCPRWLEFLKETHPDDASLQHYLWRLFGYWLTAVTTEQAVSFFIGVGGSGKSSHLEAARLVLGPYYGSIALRALLASSDETARLVALVALRGLRLARISETPKSQTIDTNTLKALTGSDPIRACAKYKNEIEFLPTHKLVIPANRPPKLDLDDAAKQRIHVVRFDQVFRNTSKDDKDLWGKFKDEAPGILSWAVDGCLQWQAQGLQPPQSVLDSTAQYFDQADSFKSWVEDTFELHPDYETPAYFTESDRLHRLYAQHCKDIGEKPSDVRALLADLREKFPHLREGRPRGKGFSGKSGVFGLRPRRSEHQGEIF